MLPNVCWYPLPTPPPDYCPTLALNSQRAAGSSQPRPSAYQPGADAPCSEAVGRECVSSAPQRVAVCLAGAVRTFTRPHVAKSVGSNLLATLSADVTELFAVLRATDVDMPAAQDAATATGRLTSGA